MNKARIVGKLLATVAGMALLTAVASPSDKQSEGRQLVARALDLWNIRSEGAPGFRMQASFQVVDGTVKQGAYSELWISSAQWRREINAPEFRQVEVAQAKRKWLIGGDGPVHMHARIIAEALDPHILVDQLKVKEITDKQVAGKMARCVESENQFVIDLYCINPADNALVLRESLSRTSEAHRMYLYLNYESFGTKVFPRAVQYKGDNEPGLEIRVAELAQTVSPDTSQFVPPPGALELGNCPPSQMRWPIAKVAPDPDFPRDAKASSGLVVLSLIVSSDGLAYNVQVARSGGEAFDKEAMRTVERWRFKPASCLGEPIAAQINIEVEFHRGL